MRLSVNAALAFQHVLSENIEQDTKALRISVEPGCCSPKISISFAENIQEDETEIIENNVHFYVSNIAIKALENIEFDFENNNFFIKQINN